TPIAQTVSSVQATPVPSATSFAAGPELQSIDNFYNGANVVFASGLLNGQRGRITGYNGTTHVLTFAANTFAMAPAPGDLFRVESTVQASPAPTATSITAVPEPSTTDNPLTGINCTFTSGSLAGHTCRGVC